MKNWHWVTAFSVGLALGLGAVAALVAIGISLGLIR